MFVAFKKKNYSTPAGAVQTFPRKFYKHLMPLAFGGYLLNA